MDFNAQRQPGLYRRVGLACNLDVLRLKPEEADRKTIQFIRKFLAELGLSEGLRAYGVKESLLDPLATQAFADSCHATNPVPVSRDDLKALYQAAL
jgi:alcohol dehydrogenase class IV